MKVHVSKVENRMNDEADGHILSPSTGLYLDLSIFSL